MLGCLASGRYQLAFRLPAMAPAVKGLGVHPCGKGDFSHAFTVRRAHPLADLSPQRGVVRRLHHSWFGPLVYRSDRADNFAGSGGRLTSAAQRRMANVLIVEANAAGVRLVPACCEFGISLRTLKRWRSVFGGNGDGATGADRASTGRLRPIHCLGVQLLSNLAPSRTVQTSGSGTTTACNVKGAAPQG